MPETTKVTTPMDRSDPSPLHEAFDKQKDKRAQNAGGFNDVFRAFSTGVAKAVGSKWAFILSVVAILAWAVTGPHFHYGNTWQLVINTATTIVTFLMVFLIQNTQNRDAKAIHLKLDELIRGVEGARTHLVDLENLSDEELERLDREFKRIQKREVHKEAKRAEGESNGSENGQLRSDPGPAEPDSAVTGAPVRR